VSIAWAALPLPVAALIRRRARARRRSKQDAESGEPGDRNQEGTL
jgi:hypothetical protein